MENKLKAGLLTLGCRVNQYESQSLAEKLEKLGATITSFSEACDIYIINTCAVTEQSERKSRQMVRRAIKNNPSAFVAVTGCASQSSAESFERISGVSYICGTRNKNSVIDAVAAWLRGESYPKKSIEAPIGEIEPSSISRFERTRAYVKIQDGCENNCAYCIIPTLRGKEVNRREEDIIEEVKSLARSGCHEVVLTGIETASYGSELVGLTEKISEISGIERIRFGSLEPSFVKQEFASAIAAVPKVARHFHLSVQSGCDRVLRAMRRKYNTKMLSERMSFLRSLIKGVMFSADIIVGFPGETEEMFSETCEFVRSGGFLHLHIFTYSKRPKTEASELLNQIPDKVKNERLHVLSKIAEESKREILAAVINAGEPVEILLETVSEGMAVGHTDNFIECGVILDSLDCQGGRLQGMMVKAIPKKVEGDILLCEIIHA